MVAPFSSLVLFSYSLDAVPVSLVWGVVVLVVFVVVVVFVFTVELVVLALSELQPNVVAAKTSAQRLNKSLLRTFFSLPYRDMLHSLMSNRRASTSAL